MHDLLHSLFCHPTPFYRLRMLQDIVLQDSPWIKLRLDHAHNLTAVSGVTCEPKCYTKLNTVSWLSCCKEAVICMDRDYFRLQNYNRSILFQNKSQFINLSLCFWFPACKSLTVPCDRAMPVNKMPPFSSWCFTSPKQRVPSSCIHNIQPLSLCCASATARTSLLFFVCPADTSLLSGQSKTGHSDISLSVLAQKIWVDYSSLTGTKPDLISFS